MPNIKSQKKRMIQAEKARIRNKAATSKNKTLLKKVLSAENNDTASEALNKAYQNTDQLAQKNIIHKNKANRIKSKLAKSVNKLKTK